MNPLYLMIAVAIILVLCGLDLLVSAMRGVPPHVMRWEEEAPDDYRYLRVLMAMAMMCLGLAFLAMTGNLWQAAKIIGAIGFVAGVATLLIILYMDEVACNEASRMRRLMKQNNNLN